MDSICDFVNKEMDLPPQNARILRAYDLNKKWDVVCKREQVVERGSPKFYLDKLRGFLDPKNVKRLSMKKKLSKDDLSTSVLKHIEISLRTNSIDWVQEFLNEQNQGLDVLLRYIQCVQDAGGLQIPMCQQSSADAFSNSPQKMIGAVGGGSIRHKRLRSSLSSRHFLGDPEEDVHVGIQCLRAIMNNRVASFLLICIKGAFLSLFSLAWIQRRLRRRGGHILPCAQYFASQLSVMRLFCYGYANLHIYFSFSTKTVLLVLLAAVCFVNGGHDLITRAFSRFRKVGYSVTSITPFMEYGEDARFQTLFSYFRDDDTFQVDFMVSCMQFINIIVHSVEDLTYRVYLQHEFTLLGLDGYLEKLKNSECEELLVQVNAYFDNVYDVGQLAEDAEQKASYMQRVEEVEVQLSCANDRIVEMEAEHSARVSALEKRLTEAVEERDQLMVGRALRKQTDTDLSTLKRALLDKENEMKKKAAELESTLKQLTNRNEGLNIPGEKENMVVCPPPPPPPPPPPAPPLPGRSISKPSDVPAPPPLIPSIAIKKRVETKYKLPLLNWSALRPNQVKGTVFNDLDDDQLLKEIDFDDFEELFKIGPNIANDHDTTDAGREANAAGYKATNPTSGVGGTHKKESILGAKRLQNLAILKRKLAMEASVIMKHVNSFDLQALTLDNVDILRRILPTAEETKAYKEFEQMKKPVDSLCEEDSFLLELCHVERLAQKLQILNFMGTFKESAATIVPVLDCVTSASQSLRKATKFGRILEVILAYGNYMNSSKKGGVYGFRIKSLDMLPFMKSPVDKSISLLHVVAATVRRRFPDLLDFDEEFDQLDKAAGASLETLPAEVAELERSYDLVKKECTLRGDTVPSLVNFLASIESDMQMLRSSFKRADESFKTTVQYFGETVQGTTCAGFFTIFVNFIKHWKQADADNLSRWKAEERKKLGLVNGFQYGGEDLNATNSCATKKDTSRKRDPKEMGIGTFDDIILGKFNLAAKEVLTLKGKALLSFCLLDITREPYTAPKRNKSSKHLNASDMNRSRLSSGH
ncbi:formin protein CG32138 like [Trichuris trichiura]|uniref:Formin protein CG32138 like n=1 Tax=Trichuris trichiura TaxID=36087 RepID=A0A077Z6P0_TRITR|nr:formin protein CG32138 like [Trichuris trichiura]